MVCAPLTVPFLVHYKLLSLAVGPDRALESSSQHLSLWPGFLGNYVRGVFLGVVLEECHPDASVGFGVLFSQTRARIAKGVVIGARCHLGWVNLEEGVLVAPGVQIPSGGVIHQSADTAGMMRDRELARSRVSVGRGAWIGASSVVLADVGENTVVAASSVVSRPLPANVIAGGNPARVIAKRQPLSVGR